MTTESVAPTQVSAASPSPDISQIVAGLRQPFATGRTRDVEWRKDQLMKLDKMMVENEAVIADALAQDLDCTRCGACLADSAGGPAEARSAAKRVKRWTRRRYRMLEVPQLPGRGWIE